MLYILSSKTGILTARSLGRLLNIRVKKNPLPNIAPVIRWGNTNGNYSEDTLYNDKNLISIASNKLSFSRFATENELECLELKRNVIPEFYPVFIRTLLNSYGGRGIVIAKNEDEFSNYQNYYYTSFKRFQFELRVHVLGGNVVKIFRKLSTNEEDEFPIRNSGNGYHFARKNIENYPKVSEFVSKIYEKFPMNLMGIDLGYDQETRKYFIIEINSCPSLNIETLEDYRNFLSDKI